MNAGDVWRRECEKSEKSVRGFLFRQVYGEKRDGFITGFLASLPVQVKGTIVESGWCVPMSRWVHEGPQRGEDAGAVRSTDDI